MVIPGQIFLCQMINTVNKAKQLDYTSWLIFKSNLAWWHAFIDFWNSKSMMHVVTPMKLHPSQSLRMLQVAGAMRHTSLKLTSGYSTLGKGLWDQVSIHNKNSIWLPLHGAKFSTTPISCSNVTIILWQM